MSLKFSIDLTSAFGDSFEGLAKRYPVSFHKTLRKGIKAGTTQIAESARANHRFENDTHTLEQRAIAEDFDEIDKLIGVVKIDPTISDYGYRIHEGFGTWEPDQFIFEAGEREKDSIIKMIYNRVKNMGKISRSKL